jgi:RNA polymerase sigma-70 factor (ECF subfamily)
MGVSALSGGVVAGWTEFGGLYRDEAPRLMVFGMSLGLDRDRAADVAHESLVALWRRWEDVPGAPRTFARVLAVRAGERGHADDTAQASDGCLRVAVAARHEAFLTGLADLPARQRQVLVATFDDLTPEDVAQVLQIRVDAVAPAVTDGLTTLESRLGAPARPAYEDLVADVAEAMDLEAGLTRVEAQAAATTEPAAPAPPADDRSRPGPGVPEELVTAAMTGDRDAVARLLEVLRPLVARYCRGRLGSVNRSFLSADDVAQEVCLAVLGALPNYRVQGRPFLAFVYGIAAHKVIDAHRAVTRTRTDPVEVVPDTVETEAGPEQHAMRGELSGQLRVLLEELPEKQREILVLRIVVGLSAEETAEIVGATAGAVRVAQHRALTRLRKSVPRDLVQGQS